MKQVAGSKCTLAQNLKKNMILREIHQQNLISRSDLCKITNLTPPVMSRLTADLIREGLIVEVGISPSRDAMGRRGVLLGLNKSLRYVVGVDVGASKTRIIVSNLGSEVIARDEFPTSKSSDHAEFLECLADSIKQVVAQGRLELKIIDSLVLGVPGSILPDSSQLVTTCNIPAFQNINLIKPLEKMLGINVRLTNTASAWCLAEHEHCKSIGEEPDFLLAGCGYGVTMVQLLGGKAFFNRQSPDHARVDFGHIVHSNNGPLCNCGQKGCIEAYSSGWAIARDAQVQPSSLLLELVDGDSQQITAENVFDAAKRGDNACLNIIREAGMVYGRWLAVFVQFYMPKRVIFGGQLVEESHFYYDALLNEMDRHIPPKRREMVIFQRSALDKYRAARGAASMSVHELLNEKIEGLIEMAF